MKHLMRIDADSAKANSSTCESHTSWQRFSVPFEYPVVFTRGLFDLQNRALVDALGRLEPDRCHRVLVFVDEDLAKANPGLQGAISAYAEHHSDAMSLAAPPVRIPGGEKIKNDLHFVEQIQRQLYDAHIDRHAYCIAIGGGALLDAVGLAAATTHRGVRHIRVPSTVLAQDDSGVGVKNGVNLYGAKNFVGSFAPPFAVLNDHRLLDTLPRRDQIAGMAEAVKVALIRDHQFFIWLERNADALVTFDDDAVGTLIRRCAELHMHQIAHGGDPFETGSARPLDYGHWAAHKLESMTRHHLRHGEAVAIGLALDTRYSVLTGMLAEGEEERVCYLLEYLGFKLWHPALTTTTNDGEYALLAGLEEFREHLGGDLTITLLEALGVGVEVHEMDSSKVLDAIHWLERRQQS